MSPGCSCPPLPIINFAFWQVRSSLIAYKSISFSQLGWPFSFSSLLQTITTSTRIIIAFFALIGTALLFITLHLPRAVHSFVVRQGKQVVSILYRWTDQCSIVHLLNLLNQDGQSQCHPSQLETISHHLRRSVRLRDRFGSNRLSWVLVYRNLQAETEKSSQRPRTCQPAPQKHTLNGQFSSCNQCRIWH